MNPLFKDKYHAEILPVEKGLKRPLWSVLIPTYNCACYLRETLISILSQDPGEDKMEIIVIDDHSTKDDPEKVVNEIGRGRVEFIRQPENIGKSNNYATGLHASKGQFIHLLHGDDKVNMGFYIKMQNLLKQYPEASASFCQCNYIDKHNTTNGETGQLANEDGIFEDFTEKIATWQMLQPPSVVFKREVYENLGGYDNRLKHFEDWEFYVRAAQYYRFSYTPEKLANYRVFPESSSQISIIDGKRINSLNKTIAIINNYLPEKILAEISQPRNEAIANYWLNFISQLAKSYNFKGFSKVTLEFARHNKNIRLWGRWLKFSIFYWRYT